MLPSMNPSLCAMLCANLCSLAMDYCARQKLGGLNLNYYTMQQLPMLQASMYSPAAGWDQSVNIRDWLLPRVLELTYTSWDLQPFAEDCGNEGPPYIWNANRRFQLQCEIDAAFFHLYGISRDDADYILDTFDVLKRSDIRRYNNVFRTKQVILEIYEALARAVATGNPYTSPLPPPRRAE